jgi:hypothetical protein
MLLQVDCDLFQVVVPFPTELVVVQQDVEEGLVELAVVACGIVAKDDGMLAL